MIGTRTVPVTLTPASTCEVPPQRDDVERRIVERAVEDEAARIDGELLAVREIGAVHRVELTACR